MKNFTQKFIRIFALVFAAILQLMLKTVQVLFNQHERIFGYSKSIGSHLKSILARLSGYDNRRHLQIELDAANQQITGLQNQLNSSLQAHIDAW